MSQTQTVQAPPGTPIDLQVGAYIAEEWLFSATFPATTPAGSIVNATVTRNAGAGALASVQSPYSEVWHVENIYFAGTLPAPDIQLIVVVNNNPQPFTLLASS